MCFSSTASFSASAAIAIVSAVAFKKATTRAGYVVACIPLFFAVQQALEGVLWISLRNPAYAHWQDFANYGFLLFAEVVWAIIVPLMTWMIEPPGMKKNIMAGFLAFGCAVGAYFLWCLIAYSVTPVILGQHIRYELHFPGYNKNVGTAAYLLATVIPPLMSRVRAVQLFGAVLLVSLIVTAYFYKGYLISVWCFFAAILSVEAMLITMYLGRVGAGKTIVERELYPQRGIV